MKKFKLFLKTINKTKVLGFLATVLYIVEMVFNIAKTLCLPDGWYYTFVSILFLIISYAIRSNDFSGKDILKFIIHELTKEERRINGDQKLNDGKHLDELFDFDHKDDS